jgi:hypothetical protein
MVKKNIIKNLMKQASKKNFEPLVVSGAGLEEIRDVVEEEALRKNKKGKKSAKRGKKSCGCDA